jgi:hypothetical protein
MLVVSWVIGWGVFEIMVYHSYEEVVMMALV